MYAWAFSHNLTQRHISFYLLLLRARDVFPLFLFVLARVVSFRSVPFMYNICYMNRRFSYRQTHTARTVLAARTRRRERRRRKGEMVERVELVSLSCMRHAVSLHIKFYQRRHCFTPMNEWQSQSGALFSPFPIPRTHTPAHGEALLLVNNASIYTFDDASSLRTCARACSLCLCLNV